MKLSPSQARCLLGEKRGNKYKAKRVEADGITFASIKERNRYLELRLLEKKGLISHLECQPSFNLMCGTAPVRYESGRQARYVADFAYFDGKNRIVEDVKSPATRTAVYKLKRAIVEAMHPAVRIREV